MNTAGIAAHVCFLSALIACAAPSNDHPDRRCDSEGDCPDGSSCHAGFCIEMDVGKQVAVDDFGNTDAEVSSSHDASTTEGPTQSNDAGTTSGDDDDQSDEEDQGEGDAAPVSEPDAGATSEDPKPCFWGQCCGFDMTQCDGECVDLLSALTHCGDCGNACGSGLLCLSGQCCKAEQILCDGQCVDPQKDKHHCGGCGVECDKGPCKDGECRKGTP